METLEIERDSALLKRLRRAESELKKGQKGKSLEEIHKALNLYYAAGKKNLLGLLKEGYLEMGAEAKALARAFEAVDRESLKYAD